MANVIGWTMAGSYYRRGFKYPGHTALFLDNGKTLYYPESIAIGPALDRAESEGYRVADARVKLANWVQTGQGVRFELRGE